jgi:hypothetical protein
VKPIIAVFTLLLLSTTRFASAESAIVSDLNVHEGQIEAQAHFGVATAPFDVAALHEAKGQAFVLLGAGRYALDQRFWLELGAPFVLGSVAQPAGSYVDATALGNPQLGARYCFLAPESGGSGLALFGAAEIGLPLASHARDLMPNRVLAIANGIEGQGHPEWFTPGVAPLTPSTVLRWVAARWTLEAELRLPLLIRVSDADMPRTGTNSVGFASIVGVDARYRLSQRLSLASAAHLFFDLVPAAEHVRSVSRVQPFERLSLYVHLGSSSALAVDLQTAIGGELGGSTVAGGLRAAVNLR